MTASVRAEINRANAQQSTGPQTGNGKAASSRNAWKHGLTARKIVHTDEEQSDYLVFAADLLRDLQPVGAIEEQLAQSIVDTYWRLNRVPALESNLLQTKLPDPGRFAAEPNPEMAQALAEARAWVSVEASIEKLSRYESRLSRQLLKLREEFRRAQNERLSRQKPQATADSKPVQITHDKPQTANSASFRKNVPAVAAKRPANTLIAGASASSPAQT